jgi:outer membrane lipoprotein-sorting protein
MLRKERIKTLLIFIVVLCFIVSFNFINGCTSAGKTTEENASAEEVKEEKAEIEEVETAEVEEAGEEIEKESEVQETEEVSIEYMLASINAGEYVDEND